MLSSACIKSLKVVGYLPRPKKSSSASTYSLCNAIEAGCIALATLYDYIVAVFRIYVAYLSCMYIELSCSASAASLPSLYLYCKVG